MRKVFLMIGALATFALLAASFPTGVFADTVPPGTINARILPSIWYSELSAEEGKAIEVHAAIQNNSSVAFAGTAMLYVDDVLAGEKSFSSEPGSLKDVFISWKATTGKHVFQMKVKASLPSDKDLISYKSDLSYMSVSKVVTFEAVKDSVIDTVSSVVSQAVEGADDVADAIIEKLESIKRDEVKVAASRPNQTVSGESLASGESGQIDANFSKPQIASVFNSGIDILSFLVDQWKWSLSVIALLALFIFLKSRSVF